jgi:senataxin
MTTTSIEYAGTLKPNDAAETLARARQKRQQASSSHNNNNNNNNNESSLSTSSQKRPSMMRGSRTSSTMSTTATSSVKSTSTFTNKGSLASILLSNTSTAKYMQPNGPTKLLKHYEKVVPDDYWKNMISWDILSELNDRMMSTKTTMTTTMTTTNDKNNNGLNTKKKQPSSTTITTTTPLPDIFESYREYCALWAPLLLEEARAQLLSEIISDIPYWRKAKIEKGPVRVFLEPNMADLNSSLDIISVRVKHVLSNSNEYKDRSFMVHDIVLLMREESFIWDAYDGKLLLQQKTQQQQQQSKTAAARQPSRFGIVGYIEYGRRSIEGLTIHVSKDLWSNIGKSEMVLIKLGCNITSLREFTALCRMDSIPLSEYILGAKMSSKNSTLGGMAKLQLKNTVDTLSDEHLEKKDILSMMGGSSALGKGFAEYASQKFNLSQLGAISASAQDYGNGGFTLIKGPPGTGKVSINII